MRKLCIVEGSNWARDVKVVITVALEPEEHEIEKRVRTRMAIRGTILQVQGGR